MLQHIWVFLCSFKAHTLLFCIILQINCQPWGHETSNFGTMNSMGVEMFHWTCSRNEKQYTILKWVELHSLGCQIRSHWENCACASFQTPDRQEIPRFCNCKVRQVARDLSMYRWCCKPCGWWSLKLKTDQRKFHGNGFFSNHHKLFGFIGTLTFTQIYKTSVVCGF